MELIEPKDFIKDGFFRESAFREAVEGFDWSRYEGKPVLIQGCGSVTIPTWAYLVLMAKVTPFAKSISYGEIKSPIPVSGSLGAGV